jgi:hypothetical protein
MNKELNKVFFNFKCRDLQSYLAELTIFLCPHTKKFLILLDNRPWLLDQDTKPAHLWQLMVTKVCCSRCFMHTYGSISFLLKFHCIANNLILFFFSSQGFPLSPTLGLGEREMKLMGSLYSQQARYLLPIYRINLPGGIP